MLEFIFFVSIELYPISKSNVQKPVFKTFQVGPNTVNSEFKMS